MVINATEISDIYIYFHGKTMTTLDRGGELGVKWKPNECVSHFKVHITIGLFGGSIKIRHAHKEKNKPNGNTFTGKGNFWVHICYNEVN